MNNLILIFINLYEIHISLQKSNTDGSLKGQRGKKKPVVRYKKKRTYQIVSSISLKKVSVSEYGQEIPQTHSAYQPTALRGRTTKY